MISHAGLTLKSDLIDEMHYHELFLVTASAQFLFFLFEVLLIYSMSSFYLSKISLSIYEIFLCVFFFKEKHNINMSLY